MGLAVRVLQKRLMRTESDRETSLERITAGARIGIPCVEVDCS